MTTRCLAKTFALTLALLPLASIQSHAQFQGCEHVQQISLEECESLQKLFTETEGVDWFRSRGWLRSNQPCTWYGVTCASGAWPRNVTRIELPGNNMRGSLPGELSILSELQVLNFDNRGAGIRYRRMSGTIPGVLGQLEHLRVLRLDDNEFSGSIPLEFRDLQSLRVLGLSQNELTGPLPEELGNLSALETLDLSDNQLGGFVPDTLGALQDLEFLNLAGNQFTGRLPASLNKLNRLHAIDLSRNQFLGSLPDSLEALTQLLWLSFAENALEGPLPLTLATFGNGLATCQMEQTNLCLPDAPPYEALGTGSVCGLSASGSCRACKGDTCDALETLYYEADGPNWPQAEGWLASSSPCTWYGVGCEDNTLKELNLSGNGLQGQLPPELGGLDDLSALNLSDNDLSGAIPEELGQLLALSTLNLRGNSLRGPVPLSVATLGAGMDSCDLTGNLGLCVPDEPAYQALGTSLICGLPLA